MRALISISTIINISVIDMHEMRALHANNANVIDDANANQCTHLKYAACIEMRALICISIIIHICVISNANNANVNYDANADTSPTNILLKTIILTFFVLYYIWMPAYHQHTLVALVFSVEK